MDTSRVLVVASGLALGILCSAFVVRPIAESLASTVLEMDLGEVVDNAGRVVEGRGVHGPCAEWPEGAVDTGGQIAVASQPS
jgi:hypothetical protein